MGRDRTEEHSFSSTLDSGEIVFIPTPVTASKSHWQYSILSNPTNLAKHINLMEDKANP